MVVRFNQTDLSILRAVVVDLVHKTKKLDDYFTKLITCYKDCLVKNDQLKAAAFFIWRLFFKPSKLNTTSALQIKAKVIALSAVKASP